MELQSVRGELIGVRTRQLESFSSGGAYRRSLAVVRAVHLMELQQRLSLPIVQTKQAISQMRAKKYADLSSSQSGGMKY